MKRTIRKFTKRYKPLQWVRDGHCIRTTNVYINNDGYPVLQRNGDKPRTIARTIILRRNGPLPSSILSRHTCDNRWCVNPNHIITGTTQENTADRVARKRTRTPHGEQNGLSKLSDDNVRTIRTLWSEGFSQPTIARMFGIHQTNVHYILSGKTWRHVQ